MGAPLSPGRLWRTLRHLRLRQVRGQLRHRLRDRLRDPARFNAAEAGPAAVGRGFRVAPPGPAAGANDAASLLGGRFSFIGESVESGWPPEWIPAGRAKLWTYNLHYFDWIWHLDPGHARDAVADWIERYRPARRRDGWEAYPVSVRTMNWIAYFHGHHGELLDAEPGFAETLWRSLHEQLEWLEGRLEVHLLANHLFENATALALAGAVFDGPAAAGWSRTGCGLLEDEIREQIPEDGLHYERSPMYHQRILYLLLLLGSVADSALREQVRPALERALDALTQLVHPDGDIALLNDAAVGIYPAPAALVMAARMLGFAPAGSGEGAFALEDAGYYGFRRDRDYVICDAGDVAPDYMPGHAHGDIFSYELSRRGHRVVVDAGVHDYVGGALRDYCRSTRAHNTVEIEGRDQCEFWGAFRVGRRGRPRDVVWRPGEEGFELEGWHDGYLHLAGAPRHQRVFRLHTGGALEVQDQVTAGRDVHAQSRIHLHPDCRVIELASRRARIRYAGGELAIVFSGDGRLTREPSRYCPRFGSAIDSTALVHSAHGRRIDFGYRIEA